MSSNPAYIGPGYWAAWHIKSLKADNREKKTETARSIVIDVINFPCKECNKDAKEYVRTHPMLEAINSDDPHSLFNWTVDFHNYVNLKLRKKVGSISYENAQRMWNEDSICVGDCGLDEEEILREGREGREKRELEDRPSSSTSVNSDSSDSSASSEADAKIIMKGY